MLAVQVVVAQEQLAVMVLLMRQVMVGQDLVHFLLGLLRLLLVRVVLMLAVAVVLIIVKVQ
jgi:hypothetical protein